jgi:ATP-dependent RNA helicase RhlE
VNFESFSFHPHIQAGVAAAGYSTPTPIQSQTIPAILGGRDVLGLAQTGTGKTAAFVLPILQRLLMGPRSRARALILAPTRELAEQTHMAIQALGRRTGLRSITIYGGVSAQPQIRGLRGGAEILVACPGRLLDLMGQGPADLRSIEILVLDEADQMFDMGFLPSVRRILNALPARRQTLLFSATMPVEIRSLADELLHRPVTVEIGADRPVDTVSHAIYAVDAARKTELLFEVLRLAGSGRVLIFTRTKHRAKKLAQQLAQAGLPATSLQGNLSQNRRQEAMDGFRSGRVRILVATDIAARGIDVSQISHVINYDLPNTVEAYTHRIGRTGRMTQRGMALSLVTAEDLAMLRAIERLLGHPLERRKLAGFEVALNGVSIMEKSRPGGPGARGGRKGGRQQNRADNRPAAAQSQSNSKTVGRQALRRGSPRAEAQG